MADKPSRGMVIYGDGLAIKIQSSHTHLHSLASRAFCGFLSLPNSPPSESEDARILREFAELVDASEAYGSMGEECAKSNPQEKHLITKVSERFMGMKAAIISNNSHLRSFSSKLGLTVLKFNELVGSSHSGAESHVLASDLLRLLGFEEGKSSETVQFDLVFVQIGAGDIIGGFEDIDFVDNLVGAFMDIAHPGTEVGSRLLMSVAMSYGSISGDEDIAPVPIPNCDRPELASLLPRQSYTMKEGKPRENVRHHSPMLIAQWQHAVTRKDMVESYSFEDFRKHGGNLVIPADRFVHEVAFKLWKAPKYGA